MSTILANQTDRDPTSDGDMRAHDPATRSTAHVAICIPTFMRPVGLARLLQSLRHLRIPEDGNVSVQIIVVDNDSAGSAQAVVQEQGEKLPWPVIYAIEPQRGVSHVRNRLVSLAGESGCDSIAFVDDDEHVVPDWLYSLVAVQRQTGAEIVLGPVVPDYEGRTPDWVISGGFFDWPRYPTGTRVGFGETSTGLYRLTAFAGTSEPFDPMFARTGSEDTFLFMRVLKRGGTIVWADGAVACEVIPESRATLGWILRRSYRAANSFTRCEYIMNPSNRVRAARFAKGLTWIALGAAGIPLTVLRGRAFFAQSLARVCKGAGMISGVAGHRYEEYHQVHGS
jgi:succinoglycan biosynthesis protein ExoM